MICWKWKQSNAIHTFLLLNLHIFVYICFGFSTILNLYIIVCNHFIKRDSRREVCTHFWSRSWTPSAGPGSLAWSPSTSWCWASPPLLTPGWRASGRWREPRNFMNSCSQLIWLDLTVGQMKSSEQRKNVWRSAQVKLLPTKNCPPLSVSFFSSWV